MIVFAFVRIKNIDNGHGEAERLVKLLQICLIHILDASANQFHKLKYLNLCYYAEHDK
ncbi:BnaC03g14020D [Brassica napus]|uniref:(rape) hypothetical protein n=1 Tax=Brassica napus TaxID=3708 RepID=A0A078FFC6_BRANA|nr:unnamed protein product [Brassica napus]CDY11976.1 BnaC03g14020D [Brassica napus]